ncbi:MAG: thiamine diphosphokinase, partial [Clostridia bacterium]|nr:thiamine diphosphokinase [Clostridia bacterium]
SGGEFHHLPDSLNINKYDLIIAADSGYLSARSVGVVPDVFIGDFDSVLKEEICAKKIISLNPVKDKTDTQEAIDYAISEGAKEITILGALGKRTDHTIANIHLLKYAHDLGAKAEILDIDTYIALVTDELSVEKKIGCCLSLLPLTDCLGVSVSGVFYPLNNADMPVGNPYGISNEFTDDTAKISVKSGELLVIVTKS